MQFVDDSLVEGTFLFSGSYVEEDELDEYDILRPSDPQIVWIRDQIFGLVFCDDLESVFGHSEVDGHLLIHDVGNGPSVLRRFAFDEIDPSKGMKFLL